MGPGRMAFSRSLIGRSCWTQLLTDVHLRRNFRTNPTEADLLCPQLGRLDTSPTFGAHTVFPLLRQPVPSLAAQAQNSTRDFVILVNEAGGGSGAGICTGNRQLMYFVDVTTGTSGNEAKPTIISNYQVPEDSGDFCNRGVVSVPTPAARISPISSTGR